MKKRVLSLVLALVMLLSLAACGGGGGDSQPSGGDSQPSGDAGQAAPADPASGDLTEWEQSSGIYNTDETDEELYQKALEEGATVADTAADLGHKVMDELKHDWHSDEKK